MATTVKRIIEIAYQLMNVRETEIPYSVVLGQYSVIASMMQHERISGYKNPEIVKSTITFTADDEGIVNESLTNFTEDVVYLEFNEESIQQVPVNFLHEYEKSGIQAVSFFKDFSGGTAVSKAQIAIPLAGDLTVWYEYRPLINRAVTDNTEIEDAFIYFMAARLAYACYKYVLFESPQKEANKGLVLMGLKEQADEAKDLYKETVNRIDNGNKPFPRLPFMSS